MRYVVAWFWISCCFGIPCVVSLARWLFPNQSLAQLAVVFIGCFLMSALAMKWILGLIDRK